MTTELIINTQQLVNMDNTTTSRSKYIVKNNVYATFIFVLKLLHFELIVSKFKMSSVFG